MYSYSKGNLSYFLKLTEKVLRNGKGHTVRLLSSFISWFSFCPESSRKKGGGKALVTAIVYCVNGFIANIKAIHVYALKGNYKDVDWHTLNIYYYTSNRPK